MLKMCCFHYDSYYYYWFFVFESIESVNGGGCCPCRSVIELCLNLCDPMNCRTSGFPVLHSLPDFAQTHVHWVSHTIQPSHFMLPPSPLALNLSQHQRLFQSVGSVHPVAKVFSFSISPSNEYSQLIGLISLQSKGLSRVFSSYTIQRHQFFHAQLSLWSISHIRTWLLEKP